MPEDKAIGPVPNASAWVAATATPAPPPLHAVRHTYRLAVHDHGMLPASVHESAGVVTIIIAALLAGPLRADFIQPIFLIMMIVRFHALVQDQPINQEWDARLASISDKFRDLGMRPAASAV